MLRELFDKITSDVKYSSGEKANCKIYKIADIFDLNDN